MTSSTTKRQSKKIRAYQDTFKSHQGLTVLQDLVNVFHEGTSFDPNPTVAAFNEGKRSVIVYILKQLRVDIMTLEETLKEQENERSIHLAELYNQPRAD